MEITIHQTRVVIMGNLENPLLLLPGDKEDEEERRKVEETRER